MKKLHLIQVSRNFRQEHLIDSFILVSDVRPGDIFLEEELEERFGKDFRRYFEIENLGMIDYYQSS